MKTLVHAAGAALAVMLVSAVVAAGLHRGWGTAEWHTGWIGADVSFPGRVWFALGRLGGDPAVGLGWFGGLLVPFAGVGLLWRGLQQPPGEAPPLVCVVAWLAAAGVATFGMTAFFGEWMFYGGTQMDQGEGELLAALSLVLSFVVPAVWLFAAHFGARFGRALGPSGS